MPLFVGSAQECSEPPGPSAAVQVNLRWVDFGAGDTRRYYQRGKILHQQRDRFLGTRLPATPGSAVLSLRPCSRSPFADPNYSDSYPLSVFSERMLCTAPTFEPVCVYVYD